MRIVAKLIGGPHDGEERVVHAHSLYVEERMPAPAVSFEGPRFLTTPRRGLYQENPVGSGRFLWAGWYG